MGRFHYWLHTTTVTSYWWCFHAPQNGSLWSILLFFRHAFHADEGGVPLTPHIYHNTERWIFRYQKCPKRCLFDKIFKKGTIYDSVWLFRRPVSMVRRRFFLNTLEILLLTFLLTNFSPLQMTKGYQTVPLEAKSPIKRD